MGWFFDIGRDIVPAAIWDGMKLLAGRANLSCQIKIETPRAYERPGNIERKFGKVICQVEGTLNFLRKDHEVWLLTEDHATGRRWPQAWGPVHYNKQTKEWKGKIICDIKEVRIYAVVAPPTSQDLFRYYEKVGPISGYEPIERIPAECIIWDSVQVTLP